MSTLYHILCGDAHTLYHCMGMDTPTFWLYVFFCAVVIAGYAAISIDWGIRQARARHSTAAAALRDLRWIFILCATCGYGFHVAKIWFPAWRLLIVLMAALAFFTWSYVLRISRLQLVYDAVDTVEDLKQVTQEREGESSTDRMMRLSGELESRFK